MTMKPYVRWQGFRIAQLGLCIALFLTFAVATLGFSINLLVQPHYPIVNCLARTSFLFSLVGGLLSGSFGGIACLTRLADFRKTAKVVRNRSDASKADTVARWREDYKRLGAWTRRLLTWQLVAFALQVIGLAMALGITYWHRLAPTV